MKRFEPVFAWVGLLVILAVAAMVTVGDVQAQAIQKGGVPRHPFFSPQGHSDIDLDHDTKAQGVFPYYSTSTNKWRLLDISGLSATDKNSGVMKLNAAGEPTNTQIVDANIATTAAIDFTKVTKVDTSATNTIYLGSQTKVWAGIYLGPAGISDAANAGRFLPAASGATTINGTTADGAAAVAIILKSGTSYTNAGAKLLSVRSNTTEKFAVYGDGTFIGASNTLKTCAAGLEGAIAFDAASGVATGAITRLCFCSSDGASTYTWRNLTSGTNGTATTCAP